MVKESENRELQRGEQILNYLIERRASAGGHGSLYKACHVTLEKHFVAIKILHANLGDSAELIVRMEREGAILAKLAHGNIVKVVDVGTHRGLPFIIMEWLKGRTLEQVLSESNVRHRGVGLHHAIAIGHEIADALDHAHHKGIVHRDVKPANIFLQFAPDRPNHTLTKLLDFGIARIVGAPKITRENFLVGTALYASPEQARGADPSPLSDSYALGLVLYEMLVGRHPFEHRIQRSNVYPVLEAHLSESPAPFSSTEDVPRLIAELVMSCLEKQPRFRPSMLEIATLLREVHAKEEERRKQALATLSKTDPTPVQNAVIQGGNEVTDPGPPPDVSQQPSQTAPAAPAALRDHEREDSDGPLRETRQEARAFAGHTLRMAVEGGAPTAVPSAHTPVDRGAITHSAKPLAPIHPRTGTEPSAAPAPTSRPPDPRFRLVGDRVLFFEEEAASPSPRPNSAYLAPGRSTTGGAGAVEMVPRTTAPIPTPPGVRRAVVMVAVAATTMVLVGFGVVVFALSSRHPDATHPSATTATPASSAESLAAPARSQAQPQPPPPPAAAPTTTPSMSPSAAVPAADAGSPPAPTVSSPRPSKPRPGPMARPRPQTSDLPDGFKTKFE